MFFIEWWLVRRIVTEVLMFAGAVALFVSVRNKRWPLRIPVRVFSLPLMLIGLLLLCLQWMAMGCISYSHPVYSPNHRMAARVRDGDGGATGGESTVELFDSHGLHQEDVYSGGWKSVEERDIHWTDNTHLIIEYDNVSEHKCEKSSRITLECRPRLEPAQ